MRRFMWISVITLILLVLAEVLASISLAKQNEDYTLFLLRNPSSSSAITHLPYYNQLDPLLGWSVADQTVESLSFETKYNTVFLHTADKTCKDTLRIYISGGSTSDLIYNKDNWPHFLMAILVDKGYCAEIYNGAVAGYHSGQELLKVMRDIKAIDADIHISYSGANEATDPSYISQYERSIYLNLVKAKPSKILPNLSCWLRSNLAPGTYTVFDKASFEEPQDFWLKNQQLMQVLAKQMGYTYFGVLQPVNLKLNSSLEDIPDVEESIKAYQNFYPKIIQEIPDSSYLVNLSQIFVNENNTVFKDDCHLNAPTYQEQVAGRIYELIIADIDSLDRLRYLKP